MNIMKIVMMIFVTAIASIAIADTSDITSLSAEKLEKLDEVGTTKAEYKRYLVTKKFSTKKLKLLKETGVTKAEYENYLAEKFTKDLGVPNSSQKKMARSFSRLAASAMTKKKVTPTVKTTSSAEVIVLKTNSFLIPSYSRGRSLSRTKTGKSMISKSDLIAVFGKLNKKPSFDIGAKWGRHTVITSVPTAGFKNEVLEQAGGVFYFRYHPTTKLGVDVEIMGQKMSQEITFYGASFGKVQIATPISVGILYYPIGKDWFFHPYIGMGTQQVEVTGGFSIGGFPFPTKGSGDIGHLKIGSDFSIIRSKWVNVIGNIDYKMINHSVVTTMPGIGKFEAQLNNMLSVGFSLRY